MTQRQSTREFQLGNKGTVMQRASVNAADTIFCLCEAVRAVVVAVFIHEVTAWKVTTATTNLQFKDDQQ